MLVVLSPAKKMNPKSNGLSSDIQTTPQFLEEAEKIATFCKTLKEEEIARIMEISKDLAHLNYTRYQTLDYLQGTNQAINIYSGDLYEAMDISSYNSPEITFMQKHFRIISAFYGLLRPMDLIQPYRLEMTTQLSNPEFKNLYKFWGEKLTKHINEIIAVNKYKFLINLSSNEYFRVIDHKSLSAPVITPLFKERRNGKLKIIRFVIKKARGAMANFIIKNKITSPEGLLDFQFEDYKYDANLSSAHEFIFTR